jgi:hypothetical protein
MKDLWNHVIRGKCDDFAAHLNIPGRTCDIQVAEREEECIIATSPADNQPADSPESHMRKYVKDLQDARITNDADGGKEQLRRGWRNIIEMFCKANIERSNTNRGGGGTEDCGSNDLQIDELDDHQDQHDIGSNTTADDGTAYFAPWAMRNLPPKLVCDCIAAEFNTTGWETPRAVLELRRIAQIITRKWVSRSQEGHLAADTDIDTSSDDYKLKVVALFFGVHSLRKAAFWKKMGSLGLSENNFVPFYRKILQRALRREKAKGQSRGEAQLRAQHPTSRVCCLGPSSQLKYRLTIEPQDADLRDEGAYRITPFQFHPLTRMQ